MKKKEVQQRVLQYGKPLDLDKFNWDEDARVFSTIEDNLVIDFSDKIFCTFKTGDNCTFNTGSRCTFNTSYDCTFNTGDDCTFDTGSRCTFNTRSNCTFKTGSRCTFNVGKECIIVRRDVFEVIEPKNGQIIKLNDYKIKGYTIVN
jgi:hypothetical protein